MSEDLILIVKQKLDLLVEVLPEGSTFFSDYEDGVITRRNDIDFIGWVQREDWDMMDSLDRDILHSIMVVSNQIWSELHGDTRTPIQ